MEDVWRESVWRQFGAALEMLGNAVSACPAELWGARGARGPEFWYVVYHTLFFTDLHLSGSVEGFAPPEPFTLDELDPAGVMPGRVYAKEELLLYNVRHVQHHAGQLNLILRRETDAAPGWVCAAGGSGAGLNFRLTQGGRA